MPENAAGGSATIGIGGALPWPVRRRKPAGDAGQRKLWLREVGHPAEDRGLKLADLAIADERHSQLLAAGCCRGRCGAASRWC